MVTTRATATGEALTIRPMVGRSGLCLVGEVDLATAAALKSALDGLTEGDGDVHLDLAGLQFVDVSGVAVLVAAAAQLAPDRALVLHDPPPALSQILDRFWDGVARIRVAGVRADVS